MPTARNLTASTRSCRQLREPNAGRSFRARGQFCRIGPVPTVSPAPRVVLISDNAAYQPDVVGKPEADSVVAIGRIFRVGGPI